jgi:hypothetical protein
VRLAHDRIEIEVLVEELAQLQVQRLPPGAVSHQPPGLKPDIIGAGHAGVTNESLGGRDHIFDLQIRDAANDAIAAALIRQLAVLAFYGPRGLPPKAHFVVKLILGEEARIQAVVEVVAVVGDFVREIRHLGLQRR